MAERGTLHRVTKTGFLSSQRLMSRGEFLYNAGTHISFALLAMSSLLRSPAPTSTQSDLTEVSKTAIVPDTLPKTPEAVVSILSRLDTQITNRPQDVMTYAKEVEQIAISVFSRYFSQNVLNYKDKLSLEESSFFKDRIASLGPCVLIDLAQNTLSYSYVDDDNYHLNIPQHLNPSPGVRQLFTKPATLLFVSCLIGLHEVNLPVFSIDNGEFRLDNITSKPARMVKRKGLMQYGVIEELSTKGKPCYTTYDQVAEYAVIKDSTDRILDTNGLAVNSGTDIEIWTNNYRDHILNPLFNGNNLPLLDRQRQSDGVGFFKLIGQQIFGSVPDAEFKGRNYFYSAISLPR